MRKVLVFEMVSLDGYFTDRRGDMSWAHRDDPEWSDFVAGNARGEAVLAFGRKTYEQMASFWPTPQARELFPSVAEAMNRGEKLVFSRTLPRADWENTRLVRGEPAAEVGRLREEPGPDLVVMGSGTIVKQLSEAGLVDEWELVLTPIVLGGGRTLFEGLARPLALSLTRTRTFRNGNVVLWYAPGGDDRPAARAGALP